MTHCKDCGGSMTGDGYHTPIACEFIADAKAWEVDSGPHYCGFKPCECGFTSTTKCTAAGCSHPDNSRPEPEVCSTCGHGEHATCSCRQYDTIAEDFCKAMVVAAQDQGKYFPKPDPCKTCGKGEHRTCDCRQYDDDNIESDPCTEDQHDRDAGRTCHACSNDLELNADFQCVRCGAHN